MSLFAGRPCQDWEGGCVKRIRDVLTGLIEAAERNLDIIGRADCDAAQFGFPRELMAKDFRDRALTLADEVLNPACVPSGSRPKATYPATSDLLPIEVRCALDWLADVYHQQMGYWDWLEDEDEPSPRLVYKINERDLVRLRRCLDRLETALRQHPPLSEPAQAKAPPPAAASPDPKPAKPRPRNGWELFVEQMKSAEIAGLIPKPAKKPRHVQVNRLDGTVGILDLDTAGHWHGKPEYEFGIDWDRRVDLYRTKGGRWVLFTCHSHLGGIVWPDLTPPDNTWEEITLAQATDWFASEWAPNSDEERESMPPEIQAEIDRMDFDRREEAPSRPVEAMPTEDDQTRPDETSPSGAEPKDLEKRWHVISVFERRRRRNESLAVRDIAKEAGCHPSYVSKVLKPLRQGRAGSAPKGWKDSDGNLEATA